MRENQPCFVPSGHYYSPIPDLTEIRTREEHLWDTIREMPGINWNESLQLAMLERYKTNVGEISFPVERPADPTQYYYKNDQFPVLDAEVLFCMIRSQEPTRIVEIGSGYSSLISAYVNRTYFSGQIEFTCIEPYPRPFLERGVDGVSKLVQEKIENVGLETFCSLEAKDFVIIDSSHVSKIGSDVNYLYFHVLPVLNPGVFVHIHDIFLPDEYPKAWVIEQGRFWNEQYLLRAFLQFNTTFDICWSSYFMAKYYYDSVSKVFTRFPELGSGASMWLHRNR